ncbi:sigma-70 family RNA polymerase sigma factor [Candidatus Poribacteria bacterium]|nr:sigma-70 family RNA polymerase sigma factor [Candidatus Poribacteria bacterium]
MPDTKRHLDLPSADELELIDEHELVTRFQNGDIGAFNTLVLKYQTRIAKLIYRHINDAETTKDLCQEVFLKAFKALPEFKRESAFYSWLYRIAMNCCIDFLRQQSRRKTVAFEELTGGPEELMLISKYPSPSHLIEMEELGDIIGKAVNQLAPKQRRVFRLRYDQKLQIKEIAVLIDRSEGTVKTHLHHAHRRLRELLRPYLENRPLEWDGEMPMRKFVNN